MKALEYVCQAVNDAKRKAGDNLTSDNILIVMSQSFMNLLILEDRGSLYSIKSRGIESVFGVPICIGESVPSGFKVCMCLAEGGAK